MATINVLQPNKTLHIIGGGRYDELKDEIDRLVDSISNNSSLISQLQSAINSVNDTANSAKTAAANAQSTANDGVNRANAAQNTANNALPKSSVVNNRTCTDNSFALSAIENNPNVNGSLRHHVQYVENIAVRAINKVAHDPNETRKYNDLLNTLNPQDHTIQLRWNNAHLYFFVDDQCVLYLNGWTFIDSEK
ncbi:MAG: hypothetical protein K2L48_03225 [Mycoplasmoidaceae bacterium]|nr:hypothetical protein [Mycoplasmoidaceae bacterium]